MRKTILSALTVLLLSEAAWSEAGSMILAHQLDVTIDPATSNLRAVDHLTLAVKRGQRTARFSLNPLLAVRRIRLSEAPLEFKRLDVEGDSVIQVTLGKHSGKRLHLVWEYEGRIQAPVRSEGSLSFIRGEESEGRISAEGVYLAPQTRWYPDQPKSLSAFDVKVTLPKPYVAVTQGRLVEREVSNGHEISVWESTAEADGLVLVGNQFEIKSQRLGDIDISAYFLKDDIDKADMFLKAASGYIKTYSELLGPYPYPRFDIVQNFFSTGHGMPAFTLLGPYVIKRGHSSLKPGYLDHEIVHCWWGNYVFVPWETGNWCEALTSYWTNYYQRELGGDQDEARKYRALASLKYAIRVSPKADYPLRQFQSKKVAADGEIGYGKGSMFFHVVRRHVGDANFRNGMKRIVANFGGQRASWDDLRQSLEEESGQRLSRLFDSWLDTDGAPEFQFSGVNVKTTADGYEVSGELRRTEGKQMADVPVVLTTTEGKQESVVSMMRASGKFQFQTSSLPVHIDIDPDFHVFRKIPDSEWTPGLNALLSRNPILVLDTQDTQSSYNQLAGMLSRSGKLESVHFNDATKEKLAGRSVLLLGSTADVSKWVSQPSRTHTPLFAAPSEISMSDSSIRINGQAHEQNSALLAVWRHPETTSEFVGCYTGLTSEAVSRFRYVFYYGWDSYVAFGNGRPVTRGDFHTAPASRRHFAKSLTSDIEASELMKTVEFLANRNRFPNTADSQLVRTYLQARLVNAGLDGIDGSYVQDFEISVAELERTQEEWRKKRPDLSGYLKLNTGGAKTVPGRNLFGVLKGEHPEATDKFIVLGAHYDSLGQDDTGIRYPGADDNASGVAALLTVARGLSGHRHQMRHSVVFALFDAEEWGRLGSEHFVKNCPVGVKSIAGMLNLDSIGAGPKGKTYLIGASYYPRFAGEIRPFLKGLALSEGKNIDKFAYAGSDHFAFHKAGIPALDFWAGSYKTMNTERDSISAVQPEHLAEMTSLAYLTILNLCTRKNADLTDPTD